MRQKYLSTRLKRSLSFVHHGCCYYLYYVDSIVVGPHGRKDSSPASRNLREVCVVADLGSGCTTGLGTWTVEGNNGRVMDHACICSISILS